MSVGGPIVSVSLKGRLFAVAADADATRKLGGFENEVQPNGDGSARKIMTRVAWVVSGLALAVDDNKGDQEFLQALADEKDFFPIAVEFTSGDVYQGTGCPTEAIEVSSAATTGSVALSGPGILTKQ